MSTLNLLCHIHVIMSCARMFFPEDSSLLGGGSVSWGRCPLVWLGQVRLGQIRLGQVRLGQVRLGQVRLGEVRLGLRANLDALEKINHSKQLIFFFFILYVDDMKFRSFRNPENGLVAHVCRWILTSKEQQSIFFWGGDVF